MSFGDVFGQRIAGQGCTWVLKSSEEFLFCINVFGLSNLSVSSVFQHEDAQIGVTTALTPTTTAPANAELENVSSSDD